MIRVVNKKNHKPTPDDFYIGRGSVMGNPYHSKESNHPQALYKVETDKEAVIKYREYLIEQILNYNQEIIDFIADLTDKYLSGKDMYLVCFCKPNICHGDIIYNLIYDITWYINFEKLLGNLDEQEESPIIEISKIIWSKILENTSP